MSVAFFENDVVATAVRSAIERGAEEIGWNRVPRPAPKSETMYRVLRSG